jgi:ATP-binding cassette subfamily C protein
MTALQERALSLWHYLRKVASHNLALFTASLLIGILNGLLEGVGLFMLVPLLAFLGLGDGSGEGTGIARYFQDALDMLGLSATLETVLALFLVLILARGAFSWIQADCNARLCNGFLTALRIEVYNAMTGASWQHLATRRSSELSQAVTAQVDELATGATLFLQLIMSGLSMSAGVAVALIVAPGLTMAAVFFAFLIVLPMMVFDMRAYRYGARSWEAMQAIYEQLSRHLAGLKAARVLSAEDRYREEFARLSDAYSGIGTALSRNSATAGFLHSIAAAAVLSILIFIAVKSGSASIEPIMLVVIFSRLLPRIQTAQYNVREILAILPQFENLQRELQDSAAAGEAPQRDGGDLHFSRELRLQDIAFRYGDGQPLVLEGINLVLPARGATGIVGASGSGKTTLMDILAGLLVPSSGELLSDGSVIDATMLAGWRRRIAYVTQEEFLFDDSVRANLAVASPGTPDAQIWSALAAARADMLVRQLPMGLDTLIGDRGARLSRGQRQRLCLARALLGKPDLLILDEATSALNPVDEREILIALRDAARDRAVVVVAHRISTVAWTDRIIVMAHGRILEDGGFRELLHDPSSLVHAMHALEGPDAPNAGSQRPC